MDSLVLGGGVMWKAFSGDFIYASVSNFTKWDNDNYLVDGVPYIAWQYGQPNGYPTQNCVGKYMQKPIESKVNCWTISW